VALLVGANSMTPGAVAATWYRETIVQPTWFYARSVWRVQVCFLLGAYGCRSRFPGQVRLVHGYFICYGIMVTEWLALDSTVLSEQACQVQGSNCK
jgi:hypothetical protein